MKRWLLVSRIAKISNRQHRNLEIYCLYDFTTMGVQFTSGYANIHEFIRDIEKFIALVEGKEVNNDSNSTIYTKRIRYRKLWLGGTYSAKEGHKIIRDYLIAYKDEFKNLNSENYKQSIVGNRILHEVGLVLTTSGVGTNVKEEENIQSDRLIVQS